MDIAKLADVFFNGRPFESKPADSKVTVAEIIRRKSSMVLFEGKLYQVTVKQIDDEKLAAVTR